MQTKKTLIFFGSARQNGHTKKMINYLIQHLTGDYFIIDSYRETNVHPCIDCRYCWYKKGCSIKDKMEDIYEMIETYDNIVIASPMYFHSVPGPLKTIIDRLQVYWASNVRKDKDTIKRKKGILLFSGGAKFFEKQFEAGKQLGISLLDDLNAEYLGAVTFSNTDHDSLDQETISKIVNLALELN